MSSGIQILLLTIAQVLPTTGHLSRPLRDSESVSLGQGLESAVNRHPGVTDTGVLKVNSSAFEYLGKSGLQDWGEEYGDNG